MWTWSLTRPIRGLLWPGSSGDTRSYLIRRSRLQMKSAETAPTPGTRATWTRPSCAAWASPSTGRRASTSPTWACSSRRWVEKKSGIGFAGGGGGGYGPGDEGRFGQTTIAQLADYSRRMRVAGFHVLNYFNVTEFGGNVSFPAPPRTIANAEDLWKNPNDFLYASFPDAILRMPDKPLGTWGGAVILDCGVKAYQDFLIRQAERHVKELPHSSGICIDRMTGWPSSTRMPTTDCHG